MGDVKNEARQHRNLEREERRRQRREAKQGEARLEQFDNREYWEHRYTTDLERGSGVGSRGEHLTFKRDLLAGLVAELSPQSILDVGCGDLEVASELPAVSSYTGIDLSPSIIRRNQELRPEWTFIQGDFLELSRDNALTADVVVCFDVLIHQHDAEQYRSFVRELLHAARQVAILNGFESPDFMPNKRLPKICAFHEPLSATLTSLGAPAPSAIGEFRGTTIYRIDTETPTPLP